MWDSHLFNRANPKPLVLAQAVKLCHYTRAFQRPSAEGSSLWETVYPSLRVLLSGVSCNVTFRVTRGSRLEKYRCCSRSEGQQWCERSSKAKPRKSPWCPLRPCLTPQALCAFYAQKRKEERKVHVMQKKKKRLWGFKKENDTKPAAQELRLHTRNDFQFSWDVLVIRQNQKKSMHTWCFVFIIIFM